MALLEEGLMGPSIAGKRHSQSHRPGLSDGAEGAEWGAFYEQHECNTQMGFCKIAAFAYRSALSAADAYGMGERISKKGSSR
jgi:hypothetical protein